MAKNVYGPQTCIVCEELKPAEAYARPAGRPPRKRCKECNDAIMASFNHDMTVELCDKSAVSRFWASTTKNSSGCWLWNGGLNQRGYGFIQVNGRNLLVHRFSYGLHNTRQPGKLCVCHKCDRKRCVNPDHLFLGTIADNTRDRDRKNRVKWGADHHKTKLTPSQVRAIRASGRTYQVLADRYGVHTSHITRIKQRKAWARLD